MRTIYRTNNYFFATREAAQEWIDARMRPQFEQATDFEVIGASQREAIRTVNDQYTVAMGYTDEQRAYQARYYQEQLNAALERARGLVDMGFDRYVEMHSRYDISEVNVLESVDDARQHGYL